MRQNVMYVATSRLVLRGDKEREVSAEDVGNLLSLYIDIEEKGVTEPLVVEPISGLAELRVIDGDKRVRVARRLGIESLPYVLAN
ncbi:ParB N-terminal domain-containing protein [Botrimarina mediterranea]|uniref:ParB-like nuclease domain protein n=1 Tax=Botrimarina mediterranea TaxID=2528022 RepID=A0A518K5Y6_9BACT|nr:ParB N-terminal domain-containing protein [Botrimarina mediterranea]QDV73200.1 ParB-like nuclease domain protein [Botrimarina mediterranea]